MGLDDLVRGGVALAKRLTADVQVDVTHEAYASQTQSRKPTYAAAVVRKAIVEDDQQLVQTEDGKEALTETKITFLERVTVTLRDKFTLPGGVTGPTLKFGGLNDPEGGRYLTEVWLGSSR